MDTTNDGEPNKHPYVVSLECLITKRPLLVIEAIPQFCIAHSYSAEVILRVISRRNA